ncbi:Protein of unknown function [Cotesia congregata]|uniref:Uncharacterized protein n=1 Tax=Cotesia congregata TaxID=51543 RepID=A0A8J2H8G5_COTCN|nr:Protein of unknown function [Cotesia congregata]
MANLLPKLFSVNLTDPESNRSYTISVTADEAKRLEREQDVETVEALDPGLNFDEIVDESPKSTNEDSVFKWPHEAILMLLDEYRKEQSDLTSGKISQKKVWLKISDQLSQSFQE